MISISMETSSLYANLREIVQGTFPKGCNNCGLDNQTADPFLLATHSIGSVATRSKEGHHEDGSPNIEDSVAHWQNPKSAPTTASSPAGAGQRRSRLG
jgi:hypothetical protein